MSRHEEEKESTYKLDHTNEHFSTLATLPTHILDWIESNSNVIIVVSNEIGALSFVSKSVESILGYTKDELIGTDWSDKVALEDIVPILNKLANKDNSKHTFNINILNKQGEYVWFECSTLKVIDNTKDNLYYISTLRSISQNKDGKEVMIQSEKMSIAGQLAASIAHEIRNPLTSLKGFLQLLQAGGKGKDAYYRIMIDEIDKIEAITSELLFISKPMTNHKKVESIRSMIKDVIVLLRSQAHLKDIELKLVQQREINFYCDRSQIKQVFINLVKNAIESMDDPGTINIVVTIKELQIYIDVIDEGPGIPDNVIAKLADPFFTTKQSGTGLGLMITKQILDQHEAKIKVIQNKKVGSTFRVIFPNNTKPN